MTFFSRRARTELSTNGTSAAIEPVDQPDEFDDADEEPAPDPFAELKFQLHEQLIRDMDLERLESRPKEQQRAAVEEAAAQLLLAQDVPISRSERQRLTRELADEVLGFGPLEPLLADPEISEVMVNAPDKVYCERRGILYRTNARFRDAAHIMRIIERIITPLGRRLDESSPMVDARLPDGSRVNAIIPPLAVDSPTMTIRKFSKDPFTTEDLIRFGTFSPALALFLQACVEAKINMIVSGGTGSGKTTLLNVLSSYIPRRERVVTVEDPYELQMRQPHVIRLETRPPNIEGKGEVTQRQLVKNALRMRPDRIIVGEVRGGEAFDMLQAMNTGHEGSLTTIHANGPRDALARIENMVLMSNLDLPVRAIREQVSSAIHIIAQLARMRDGVRRLVKVTEVVGMEGDTVTLQDIFVFEQTSIDQRGRISGHFRATGLRPHCMERIEQQGIKLPPDLFALGGGQRWAS